jgi:outer membrane protein assembly factor BamB
MGRCNRAFFGVVPVAVVCLLLSVGIGGSTAFSNPLARSASWPYPNADIANTRDASDSAISAANVSELKPVWTFKLTGGAAESASGYGSLAATPIVENGVVYMQDLHADVYALALRTGRLKWEHQIVDPNVANTFGPNGVAVNDGRVYADSPTSVFALHAATGRVIWTRLLPDGLRGSFGIQPQVANGRVYLATQAGPGGGVLLALSASTGDLLWSFNTLLKSDPDVRAAGGAWETPLVGRDGSVTYGVGNPYQSAASALLNPSRLLYTDSVVNLDAATGKLRWYYQALPDDFKDFDMEASPISASINRKPVVIDAGKMGYVYAMDARNGSLIWKTPVGEHNGHDNDSIEAMEHQSSLHVPFTIVPGSLGGVLTNMALAGNELYVTTCDSPDTVTDENQVLGLNVSNNSTTPTGEVEALNLNTGHVEWDTGVPEMPLGAATVSRNLVFTTLYNGVLLALNRNTGAIVYRRSLPTSTNSPIAIAGDTVLVPAGGPTLGVDGGDAELVAYRVP